MRFLQFIDFKVDLRYKTAQFRHLLVLTTIPTVVNPQMSLRFDSYFFLRLQKKSCALLNNFPKLSSDLESA